MRRASAVLVAAFPILVPALIFCFKGVPRPTMHDEFAYLYQADTFRHARLANPAHPFWPHFESFDLIMRPTMASRKPPAQGLVLALGAALTGRPIAGVLLSVGAACAAIYWMLLAFVEAPWALLGTALAATHPEVFAWSTSYWGGGVAMLGGALALGAWRRLLDRPRASDSAIFGLGLAVLANSRPFEGLVFALPLAAALAWRARSRLKRTWTGAAVVLAAAAAAMAYYNLRVAGNALTFPYTLYEARYNPHPTWVWSPSGPPKTFLNPEFDEYWNRWLPEQFRTRDGWDGYGAFLWSKLAKLGGSWLTPFPLAAVFAAALCGLGSPALTALLAAVVLGATMPVRNVVYSYFSAPFVGLFFLVLTAVLRRLDGWRWRGRRLGRGAVVLCAGWAFANSLGAYWSYASRLDNSWSLLKETSRAKLEALPGKHLVLVHYGPKHSVHQEWIYNDAEMEASPVLWARALSPEDDAKLAGFYTDRSVWELQVLKPETHFKLLRPALSGLRP